MSADSVNVEIHSDWPRLVEAIRNRERLRAMAYARVIGKGHGVKSSYVYMLAERQIEEKNR
jgi:hypothetical protein